ncbi:MAG: hypothetical protein M0R70_10815 [Nitrospirae bacterium]|nr:hypothetical protein [Nitrospirota bacterium]
MASEERKFKIHIVERFDVAALRENQLKDIASAIVAGSAQAKWWKAADGLRFSLIKCFLFAPDVVCGWITQEHNLEQHLYDDKKQETKQNVDSYEDRFFVVLLSENIVILEWRQFRNKPPLNLPATVERMELILTDIVKGLGVNVAIKLAQIDRETPKDEFIKLFYDHNYQMIQVAVEKFGTEIVSSDVVLVNPNKHLEGAARELIRHDVLHPSISKLVAEAKEDRNADLRASAITRAALHSSQPILIKYKDGRGQIRIRKKTEKGEIDVQIPIAETDTAESKMEIATSVINAIKKIDIGRDIAESAEVNRQLDIFRQTEDKDGD